MKKYILCLSIVGVLTILSISNYQLLSNHKPKPVSQFNITIVPGSTQLNSTIS
jgi:hypothetical protein